MRTSVPRFNELAELLTVLAEKVYIVTVKRTRKSVQRFLWIAHCGIQNISHTLTLSNRQSNRWRLLPPSMILSCVASLLRRPTNNERLLSPKSLKNTRIFPLLINIMSSCPSLPSPSENVQPVGPLWRTRELPLLSPSTVWTAYHSFLPDFCFS